MDKISDNALMLKVKAGNLDQLGLLYERHHGALFGYFYHLTGEAALSEDHVQTVFYRILKYKHTYQGKGKFVYWMYRMARNVFKDHFRKKNPLFRAKDVEDYAGSLEDGTRNAQGSLEDLQETALLEQALAQLKANKREALVLSRFQGLKYKEIAKIMGCEEGTVKSLVHRALIDLRKIYQKLEQNEYYEYGGC